MMPDTRKLAAVTLALVTILAAATSLAAAQQLDEKKRGFFGRVVDESGQPIVGVTVRVSRTADFKDPMELKTTERGFTFPRLFEDIGEFYVGIASDEYFIRKFMLRTRGGDQRIVQNVSGEAAPNSQGRIPPLVYRGGNAIAEFVLMKIADWKAAAPPAAQATAAEPTLEDVVGELTALGDYKGAAVKLGEAVAKAPDDVDQRWNYAQLLAAAGEPRDAIREARAVLARQPERVGVRAKLAAWLYDEGQDREIIPLLEKERELDGSNTAVHKQLVAAYHAAGRKDDEAAAIARWRELAPDDIEASLALAGARAAAGDFAAAEQLYREIAQKDPANAPRSFYNVGVSIFNQKGDMNAAAAALEQAVALKPDYAKAYEMLGYVRLNQGKLAEAKAAFTKFVELAPNDPAAADIKATIKSLD